MRGLLLRAVLLFVLVAATSHCHGATMVARSWLPERDAVHLAPSGRLSYAPITECSGLVKSRTWPGVFWTINDSGNQPRIYPVTRDGTIIRPQGIGNLAGIEVLGAGNVDWEDIAADDKGHLIIGDFGNNLNSRRDLAIYVVDEPCPYRDLATNGAVRIPFCYPDQDQFPAHDRNFDAEALFWAHGKMYLLTKHRSDRFTKLYRFDSLNPGRNNPLTLLDKFEINGMVTAADASVDGRNLAVLTYNAAWLFEAAQGRDRYFQGKISRLPIWAKQCEGICFDDGRLLISNEQRELFELPLNRLKLFRK